MMRLQRVGRKNDPSYRIVVTDKRTGPKSNKHVAILGSYNPKMNHTQLDTDVAKEWLAKGVQPSDTVHNILVAQKVIDAKKLNVLPRKAPIVDEEAEKLKQEKAEEEAAAKAEAEKAAAEAAEASDTTEAATEESDDTEEAPAETEATEAAADETPTEEADTEAEAAVPAEDEAEAAEEAPEEEKKD